MPVDFYYLRCSPCCRTVVLTAKALGVEFNMKELDYRKGEHRTPEFTKINPQRILPTIVDDGFAVWESRAISVYLATKYGKDDTLYPNDSKKRAIVEHRLNFDLGTLYRRLSDAYFVPIFLGGTRVEPERVKQLEEALELLDGFLSKTKWVAGDVVTVADHTMVTTIGTMDCIGIDLIRHKNVTRWYKQCQVEMPGYKEASDLFGIEQYSEIARKGLEGKM